MTSAPAIGIDLGTTFSLAAVYRNRKSEVIPNPEGQRLIPSFIFYHPDSLEVSVGTTAEDRAPQYPENVLYDQKRLMGRKYADAYVQKLKDKKHYKFKIVSGEEDKAEIQLVHDGLKVRKTPEQASSEILKYLREYASEYLGAKVTEAVISVPAHFSNAQRKATKSAAELAGLKVLKLITEPVAGAIHYAKDRLKTQATLLVFDFGGGTLDVSIIEVNEKAFEVKSVEGNTFLGGRDFDEILLKYFREDIIKIFEEQTIDRKLHRLKKNCIHIKQKLSTQKDYYTVMEFAGKNGYIEHTLRMSQLKFEELTINLMDRSLKLVDKCLVEAGLLKEDISDVVLVGGTTRIPKMREMLRSYFSNKNLKTDLNPDEAVALGAAIQAAYLKNKFKELEKYKITEVTPLSIGIRLNYGLMKFFIKKNTPLPFKSKPITLSTSENNQTSCTFPIFEGERKNSEYNNLLGSFHLKNVPKGMDGRIKFETIASLNEDGILEVEAFETTTGNKNKLVVTLGEYRLCEYKIKNIVDTASSNLKDDEIFEICALYKTEVKTICNHLLFYLNEISSEFRKQYVEKRCIAFKDFLNDLEYTDINHLREEYEDFKNSVKPVVQEYGIDINLTDDSIIYDLVLDEANVRNLFSHLNLGRKPVTIPSVERRRRRRWRRKQSTAKKNDN